MGEVIASNENAINMEAWQEWCEYRKAKKKPVSEFAQVKQWKVLALYNHTTQQAIIDQSIMNDWQGLFPPKFKHQQEATPGSTRERTLEQDLHDRSWAE
jgi:hypothetical protein